MQLAYVFLVFVQSFDPVCLLDRVITFFVIIVESAVLIKHVGET